MENRGKAMRFSVAMRAVPAIAFLGSNACRPSKCVPSEQMRAVRPGAIIKNSQQMLFIPATLFILEMREVPDA